MRAEKWFFLISGVLLFWFSQEWNWAGPLQGQTTSFHETNESLRGLVGEIPQAWENAALVLKNPSASLCPQGKDRALSESPSAAEKNEETGYIIYRVAKVNAHQGFLLPEDTLQKKGKEYGINLSPEQVKEMKEKFFVSPPEGPGIREGMVKLPLHLQILRVDYSCQGEFCGWCYHSNPTDYGYLKDVKILPNPLHGHQALWRRLYSGREVEETYFIHWKKIGPGPNPPAEMEQIKPPKDSSRKGGLALNESQLNNYLKEVDQNGQAVPGRICSGGLKSATAISPTQIEQFLLKNLQQCCQDFGGPKRIDSSPLNSSSENKKKFPFLNWEIECQKAGRPYHHPQILTVP